MSTSEEIKEIKELLLLKYKSAKSELNYNNLYELIVSVMLSAQCTDKRVNIITPKLFEIFPNTDKLSKANLEDVKELIKSCSFFQNKSKNLIEMAKRVEEVYKGTIPITQKELVTLAGVGQKTANVVLIEHLDANLMAVDTHVFRVSHRLGLTDAKNVELTEIELSKKLETNLNELHQAMVLFGRYICKATKPDCESCFLEKYCKSKERFKAK